MPGPQTDSNPSPHLTIGHDSGTAAEFFPRTNSSSPTGTKWFSTLAVSNSPLAKQPMTGVPRRTLKPCMKQKSKSAATTPPSVRMRRIDAEEHHKLRRAKTVDFEEVVGNKPRPLSTTYAHETVPQLSAEIQKLNSGVHDYPACPRVVMQRMATYPGPQMKSQPADAALTRTYVHTVAVTPSWAHYDILDEGSRELAAPTTQLLELKAGSYEDVWGNEPPDQDIRDRRNSFPADQAPSSAASTAPKGLERVNTKLTEWSWAKRSPSGPVNPQIVVLPSNECNEPQFDCAVDEEDLIVIAPPNSEKTSGNVSRYSSRPASARMSRAHSSDEFNMYLKKTYDVTKDMQNSQQEALAVPDREATTIFAASRRARKTVTDRRLSNWEDAEVHFRGHRDSVALARSRIVNAGGVSEGGVRPELFTHRDSVSQAKKRIQARDHASSSACGIPYSKVIASDPMLIIDDSDGSESRATEDRIIIEGPQIRLSASRPPPQSARSQRHIRIVE